MGPFPEPQSTLPFWRTQPHELDTHRTTESLPTECDVLIIGAGYAGAATAFHLLKDNVAPPSVVILEARQACSGATGRNGGHLRPEVYFNMPTYIEKYGYEAAAEISKFEVSHLEAIRDLVEKEQIDCDLTLTRTYDVFLDEEYAKTSKQAYDKMIRSGITSIKDAHYTPAKQAEQVCGVKGARGCFSFTAAHIWPYKFIMHLLAFAVAKGANLQTTTPATHISTTVDHDGFWTVTTPRGAIKTKKLVFASNAYTAGIAPQYAQKIIPIRAICSRIVTPPGKSVPVLTNTYSIRIGPERYNYLIPRPDGSIIVGGAEVIPNARTPNYEHWYNVTDDSTLIEPVKNYFDGFMQRTFRGWEYSGAVTDMVWTGITGFTHDLLPHIGPVSSRPGQFIAAGFNGHGMPLIFLTGKAIAEMIIAGKTYEQTGLPRVWRASQERLDRERNDILTPWEFGRAKL